MEIGNHIRQAKSKMGLKTTFKFKFKFKFIETAPDRHSAQNGAEENFKFCRCNHKRRK